MRKTFPSCILLTFCIVVILLPLASTSYLFAQGNQEKPNPSRIIDRAAEAMGGREKLDAIFSKQIFGTVTRKSDGAIGTIEILTRRPDAYFMRLSFGNQFEQVGFNGLSVYHWSSGEGLYFLEESELKYLRAEAFYKNGVWQNYRTDPASKKSKVGWALLTGGLSLLFKYEPGKFQGIGTVAGKPVKNVGLDLFDGGHALLSFDDETGYLVSEKLNITKNLEYESSDFRRVNGVLMPYSIKYSVPNKAEYDIKVDRIIVNEAIETAKFEAPVSSANRLPNLSAIIEKAQENQNKLSKIYDQLSYEKKLRFPDTGTRSGGEGMSDESYSYTHLQTFKVSFYRYFPIEILTHDNDSNPYSTWKSFLTFRQPDYEKIDKERRLREMKKIDLLHSDQISRAEAQKRLKWDWGLIIIDSLANSHFTNFRRDKILSKDMYVVDFTPKQILEKNPNFPKEMIAGRLWIDVESGWVAKAEILNAEEFKRNSIQPILAYSHDSANNFYQKPVCDDLWLPQFKEQPGANFEATFSNYKLNGTESVCDANGKSKLK